MHESLRHFIGVEMKQRNRIRIRAREMSSEREFRKLIAVGVDMIVDIDERKWNFRHRKRVSGLAHVRADAKRCQWMADEICAFAAGNGRCGAGSCRMRSC